MPTWLLLLIVVPLSYAIEWSMVRREVMSRGSLRWARWIVAIVIAVVIVIAGEAVVIGFK